MATTSDEKALDRVRKLLALATSPDAHEAAAAAAQAQALITRHRLDRWLEAERSATSGPDAITDAREQPLETARKLRAWKVLLATTLAEHNGCVAYTLDRDGAQALVLVGRASDRAAVETLWSWLVRRIEWLSATHGVRKPRRWHDAFRVGVVDALAVRLRAGEGATAACEPVEPVEPAREPRALAVIDRAAEAHRAALERFVEENLRLGRGRSLRVDAAAWSRGKRTAAEQHWLPAGSKARLPE